MSEREPNQHYPGVGAGHVRDALDHALDRWEKAGCDCCSPTVLDVAVDLLGYERVYWERMRHFAVELAQTAQNVIDTEDDALGMNRHDPSVEDE